MAISYRILQGDFLVLSWLTFLFQILNFPNMLLSKKFYQNYQVAFGRFEN